ncbi:aspartate carbamoyltransferase regulatory subunit [Sinanaerobacter chloroacetimidivorans]|jgi:aspartate carbamoyltransferase regulatory subunit|uniref:Aspartate carbamoyltransferase regulatory subunit n=1 Tax=Sinanaerobacter chloroacetimidivorans TaxID=2818044 RepID=A0A8J7W0X0_9FIRM|nr:aspartate carbamoyltransferase regulatory subunit [Sinanaerobacter chloroacetimidivorans]MBR0598782.1 aspartate carbamoyltransferase regulatory subunit [Sinanaerobacter chloroacetimidivorans]
MVVINSIEKGIVIDHITAGLGVKILEFLDIDTTKNTVAFIMNATSSKYGRKDVIKIENVVDINLAALGLIDPKATVNIIEDHLISKKINLKLPEMVTNIVKCKNPRCVTSVEVNAPHIFHLIDKKNREYKCDYCDDIISMKEGFNNEIIHKQWLHR